MEFRRGYPPKLREYTALAHVEQARAPPRLRRCCHINLIWGCCGILLRRMIGALRRGPVGAVTSGRTAS